MNRLLVAPTAEGLKDVITEAVRVVNAVGTPADGDTVAARVSAESDGVVRWVGRNRQMTIAWWTDFAGRRHVRVRGLTRGGAAVPAGADDPLGRVYPGVAHRCGGRLVVACGCGAVGTLASLGWAGERCGPCQDRADEGGPVTPPLVIPSVGGYATAAFTPDGRELVYVDRYRRRVVSRHVRTGRTTEAPPHVGTRLIAVGFGPAGRTLLVDMSGAVVVWDRATGAAFESARLPENFQVAVSPSGAFLAHDRGVAVYAVGWDDPAVPLRPLFTDEETHGGRFDRAGDSIVFLTPRDEFVREHLPTRTRETLAPNVFAGVGLWCDEPGNNRTRGGPEPIALAPDHDLACVAEFDVENEVIRGPVRLGSITRARPWRTLAFDNADGTAVPHAVAFSPCGRYVLAGSDRGLVVYPVVDPDSPVVIAALCGTGADLVYTLAFSPDGDTLAVGFEFEGGDHHIRLVPWRRLVEIAGTERSS